MVSPDLSPERFFNDLYDRILSLWIVQGGNPTTIFFPPQEAIPWDYHEDLGSRREHRPLNLQRGVLVQKWGLTKLAIIGTRLSLRYQEPIRGLQFGFLPVDLLRNRDSLDQARYIMCVASTYPCGEFYQHPRLGRLAARGTASLGGFAIPWPNDEHSFYTCQQECFEQIRELEKRARLGLLLSS